MMNGVMQLVPECIELTDSQTQAIRKEVTVFNRVCAMQLLGAWECKVSVGKNSSPDESAQTTTLRQGDEQSALY